VSGGLYGCWDVVPAVAWREHWSIRSLAALLLATVAFRRRERSVRVRLFIVDDRAEDHHDVEVMDEAGRVLRACLG
jgi:hypothetical protein